MFAAIGAAMLLALGAGVTGARRRARPRRRARLAMIITVTLNAAHRQDARGPELHARAPAPDRRSGDDAGRQGRQHRPGDQAARAARDRDRAGGRATGTRIVEALNDESILNDFVRIHDESRTNTAVLDPTTGVHTEINERGPAVSAQELELFREKLLYLAQGASICVFAGSLRAESSPTSTCRSSARCAGSAWSTMLDTDGEPLRLAMKAEPDVVSPNELEAEELVGHEFNDDRRPRPSGDRDGPSGAARGDHDRLRRVLREDHRGGRPALYRVRIEEQEARSVVGSGDAFLAGYVAARYAGQSPVECLRFGVACGAESTQHFGAGVLEPARSRGCSVRSNPSGWSRRRDRLSATAARIDAGAAPPAPEPRTLRQNRSRNRPFAPLLRSSACWHRRRLRRRARDSVPVRGAP